MKAKELREKSVEELNTELLNLLREQFNLAYAGCKWPAATVSPVEASASDVARVKTLLNEKAGA